MDLAEINTLPRRRWMFSSLLCWFVINCNTTLNPAQSKDYTLVVFTVTRAVFAHQHDVKEIWLCSEAMPYELIFDRMAYFNSWFYHSVAFLPTFATPKRLRPHTRAGEATADAPSPRRVFRGLADDTLSAFVFLTYLSARAPIYLLVSPGVAGLCKPCWYVKT